MNKGAFRRRVLLLAASALPVLLIGCGGGEEQADRGRGGMRPGLAGGGQTGALPVRVDTVKAGSISKFILTNSTLEAQRTVEVIARVSGIVEDFKFEEGSVVRRGDLLIKLDDREMKLNMDQARAAAENAKRLHDRSKDMFEKNVVSKEAFDATLFNYESAKSQFESARLQWEYTSIVAPISGVVTSRLIELGDYISTNEVVCSVADYNTLLARVYIPERDIAKIRPNQVANITVEALQEKQFAAKVQRINPVVDPASGTVKVTVEIDRGDTGLLPGMFASVFLLTDTHENTAIVAKKSLVLESESDRVFVFENGIATLRDVEIGFTDGDRMEILSGLAPGDVVISVGHEGLRQGAAVRLVGDSQTTVAMTQSSQPTNGEQGQRTRGNSEQGQQGGDRGRQGMGGGMRGGPMSAEQLQRFEQRMLQVPEIKEAYDKKVKEDPGFKDDVEKKTEFFREQARQRFGGRRGQ